MTRIGYCEAHRPESEYNYYITTEGRQFLLSGGFRRRNARTRMEAIRDNALAIIALVASVVSLAVSIISIMS